SSTPRRGPTPPCLRPWRASGTRGCSKAEAQTSPGHPAASVPSRRKVKGQELTPRTATAGPKPQGRGPVRCPPPIRVVHHPRTPVPNPHERRIFPRRCTIPPPKRRAGRPGRDRAGPVTFQLTVRPRNGEPTMSELTKSPTGAIHHGCPAGVDHDREVPEI